MNGTAMPFTIQGKIEGLIPGDTLSFERIIMPEFKLDFTFDVIVEQSNEFIYSSSHEHIGYYMMSYKPVSGKVTASDKRGLALLVKDDTTCLIGATDQIYYCNLEGGLYDNERLQEALRLEIFLGKERSGLMKLTEEARAAKDAINEKEYRDKFNSFHSEHREDFQRLSRLYDDFHEKFPSSEHTIVDALQMVMSAPFDTSLSKYEKMNEDAQNSYFGKLLKQEIDKMSVLLPGNDAPDFHLTAMDGREISLKDCAGSYVLIYHWGLCPGSFQREKDVLDLYNRYKDRLIVVGITDRIEYIKETYNSTKPEDKLMDIEMKPVLESMLAHPWFDAEKTGNNDKIETDYAFAGLPYFVFISPDGKIMARDYHEAFYVAKNKMESEFGK
jgi:cytochrome oxidase Cu insertion factor (SCO1/SenC/PrrC family)